MAQQMNARQANLLARNLIVGGAVKRTQSIFSRVIDTSTENVINVVPRNVGLILGFIVQVKTNVAVGNGGTALTRTKFGPANLLKQVGYVDLNNNTRIQTTGWHLAMLNAARSGAPYLAVRTNTDYPMDYGNFWDNLLEAPATIAAEADGDVSMTYYVPLAYSDEDLRGSVYANVVNATQNLQLTLNNALVQARTLVAGTDAAYVTAAAGTAPAVVTVDNFEVTVYQVYYDQLPLGEERKVILPVLDMTTIYELKNTAIPGVTQGQDFPLPYSNFRDFLSTLVIYRNRPLDLIQQSDVNYIALESANYTNLFKVDPEIAGAWGRQVIGDDFPGGVWYIPTRNKPISTVQYGNMNLVFNAADVQANAAFLVGYEAFALTNIIGSAQGLPPA